MRTQMQLLCPKKHMMRSLYPLFMVIAFIIAFLPPHKESHAETLLVELPLLPKQYPQTLYYEAFLKTGFWAEDKSQDFRVRIEETWLGGSQVSYAIKDFDGKWQEESRVGIVNRDSCRALDPWWETGTSIQKDRCELWISRDSLLTLRAGFQAEFAIDIAERRDSYVSLNLRERIDFPVLINGKVILLPAISVYSSRDDDLVILDDLENPLVLKIDSSEFRWRLMEIQN